MSISVGKGNKNVGADPESYKAELYEKEKRSAYSAKELERGYGGE